MPKTGHELPIDKDAAYKHLWAVTVTWSLIGCVYFGAGLIFLLWAWLNRKRMRRWCYETSATLTDSELVIRRHSFSKTVTYIPFKKIGHVAIIQGPYLRKFGITNIQVGCNDSGATRGIGHLIPAVPEERAEEVVALIRARMDA